MAGRRIDHQIGCGLVGYVLLMTLMAMTPVNAEEVVTISVVTTNDFHGWISAHDYGDYAEGGAHWLQGYLDVVREENPGRVLHLDAGDTWEGALISDYFEFEPAIEILNLMDIEAMAFANHELATGIESFQAVGAQLDFPLLAGNVFYRPGQRPRGESWLVSPLKRFVIREVDGVKVGLIGVLDPSAVAYFGPGSWVNQTLFFADPLRTVKRSLRKTWRRGARFNIVLTHIGSSPYYQPEILEHLACNLDPRRVHLIVTGHLHQDVAAEVCGIPVVQSWDFGRAFSRIDFDIGTKSGRVLGHRMNDDITYVAHSREGQPPTYRRWDTGEDVEVFPDTVIQARVEYWETQLAAAVNDVIGSTTAPLPSERHIESVMGDWVSDRLREALEYQVDFAVFRGGLDGLDTGDITLEEVLTTFPFNNELIIIELTGDEVQQVLEEGTAENHWGLLQVSGLEYSLDWDRPDGSQLVGDVIDIDTGLPVDPTTTYLMVTTDYLANGAQGMDTLLASPQLGTEIHIRDYLIQWLQNNSPFDPPDPVVEQRIAVFGTLPP